MAINPKVLVQSKLLEAAQTGQFTADVLTRIDSAVFTNQLTTNETVSVNIVTSGDTAGSDNLFLKDRTLFPGQTYTAHELIGQYLEPGDFISTATSDGTAIACRISGIEFVA